MSEGVERISPSALFFQLLHAIDWLYLKVTRSPYYISCQYCAGDFIFYYAILQINQTPKLKMKAKVSPMDRILLGLD